MTFGGSYLVLIKTRKSAKLFLGRGMLTSLMHNDLPQLSENIPTFAESAVSITCIICLRRQTAPRRTRLSPIRMVIF
jgi:hypothetical protein